MDNKNKLNSIKWDDIKHKCPIEIKQSINQKVGKLIPEQLFNEYASNLIDFKKIKNEEEKKLFISLETLLEINFISKSYLVYLASNIESMIFTWFYNITNDNDTLKNVPIKDIPEEFWMNYFTKKNKFNDFKYKFNLGWLWFDKNFI